MDNLTGKNINGSKKNAEWRLSSGCYSAFSLPADESAPQGNKCNTCSETELILQRDSTKLDYNYKESSPAHCKCGESENLLSGAENFVSEQEILIEIAQDDIQAANDICEDAAAAVEVEPTQSTTAQCTCAEEPQAEAIEAEEPVQERVCTEAVEVEPTQSTTAQCTCAEEPQAEVIEAEEPLQESVCTEDAAENIAYICAKIEDYIPTIEACDKAETAKVVVKPVLVNSKKQDASTINADDTSGYEDEIVKE